MIFSVPQFIDVEDKIVGPLTWKQLFWIMGWGAVVFVLWAILERQVFIIAVIPITGVFGVMAFVRPYGQSMVSFIVSVFNFFFRPKVYMWKREPGAIKEKKVVQAKQATEKRVETELTSQEIQELAAMLDQQSSVLKRNRQ